MDPHGPVVVFTGLPGTGKSTLADLTARRLGAPAFSGDWLMGALRPAASVLATLDRPTSLAVYHGLLRSLVVRQLILGQPAVVDGMVTDAVTADWRAVCEGYGTQLVLVECVCSDEAVHRSRVEGRVRGIPGWHEIDWAHVQRMRTEFTPLTTERLVVDATLPVPVNLATVLAHLTR
ncbi:MAG: AAA family ATPase [Geodermatophilaceae bacterium]|nr:AAA family ATPase [Geodermatophilaceae bacterium]